jgi:hypothetical protein
MRRLGRVRDAMPSYLEQFLNNDSLLHEKVLACLANLTKAVQGLHLRVEALEKKVEV